MEPARKLTPEFITDQSGNKKAVILPIDEYYELLEDIDDLAVVAERRNKSTTSHQIVVEELRKSGHLSD